MATGDYMHQSPAALARSRIGTAVLFGLVYFLLGYLSRQLNIPHYGLNTLWLPAGLLFGALLHAQRRSRPWLIGAAFLADAAAHGAIGFTLPVGVLLSTATLFEMVVIAVLLQHYYAKPIRLNNQHDILALALALIAVGVPTLVSAAGIAPLLNIPFWDTWSMRWLSHMSAILVIVPGVLTSDTVRIRLRHLKLASLIEGLCLFLLLIGLSVIIFGGPAGVDHRPILFPYSIFPVMTWAALRFGLWGITRVVPLLAVLVFWYTTHAHGPFANPSWPLVEQMLAAQLFLATMILPILALAIQTVEQRATESALRESEQRFRQLAENIQEVFWMTDSATRTMLYISPAYERIWGRRIEALFADPQEWIAAIHPADREYVISMTVGATAPRPYNIEYRIVRPDQTIRWIHDRSFAVYDANGAIYRYVGIAEDVTEHRRAAEALRQSEERLQHVMQNMPVLLDAFDEKGLLIVWNAECERVTGYSAAEMIQNPRAMQLLYPDDSYRENKLEEWRTHSRDRGVDWRIHCKDGSIRTVSWSSLTRSSPIPGWGFWGIGIDVTERKLNEEQLQKYAERLKLMNEIDRAILSAASPAAIAQAIVSKIRDLIPCRWASVTLFDAASKTAAVLAVDSAGKTIINTNFNSTFSDTTVAHLASGRPVLINDLLEIPHPTRAMQLMIEEGIRANLTIPLVTRNELIGCLHFGATEPYAFSRQHQEIAREIGDQLAIGLQQARLYEQTRQHADELEQRVAERTAQLEAAQAELLHQERLATLGQLTATVSHELRNPLGTLRASVFSIAEKTRNRGLGVEPAIGRIERSVTRCDNIISELLDYTRAPVLQREALAIDQWLRQMLEEHTIPDGVHLVYDLQSDAVVSFDPDRFRRVIVNLVDNACQSMHPGEQPAILTIRTRYTALHVEIEIADTGTGIAPESLARVFEPLYSTRGFGVGLGLTIVQQIVEQHNGTITIHSEVGRGTQVWISLPSAQH